LSTNQKSDSAIIPLLGFSNNPNLQKLLAPTRLK
jgi:hypothetical protein